MAENRNMYIDYRELNPCNRCGMRPEKLNQRNCGPIIELRCDCCCNYAHGSTWEEIKDNWNASNRPWWLIEVCKDTVFHVHTRRCGHAGEEDDEAYVKRAKELGAKRIVFTDHAPFPGNPFGNRMDIEELPEYLSSLRKLRDKYMGRIDVQTGLEIEYLPSFEDYYKELAENEDIQWLVLGQHMYEYKKGVYSFEDEPVVKNQVEHIGICEAMIEGMSTGLFRVVAHPDRAFRRRKTWDDELEGYARRVIETAIQTGTVLEMNYASARRKNQYRKEFWDLLIEVLKKDKSARAYTIKGSDAHATDEIMYGWYAYDVVTADADNPMLDEVVCDEVDRAREEIKLEKNKS